MKTKGTNQQITPYIILVFFAMLILTLIIKDTSNVQSAHPKEIIIKPCILKDGVQVEAFQFTVGDIPHICGEVLSEYLPLELDYYLVDMNNNKVILTNYIKITGHEFVISLPASYDIGRYEFELKEGKRRRIDITSFTITH